MLQLVNCGLFIFSICLHTIFSGCPEYLIPTGDIQNAWKAAKYVYKDEATTGKTVPGTPFKIKHTGVKFFFKGGTGVKVIVAEYEKTTIISYRGSLTTSQILHQIITFLKTTTGEKVEICGEQVSVNAYFWQGFEMLYDGVKNYLNDKTRKYIITGHSLGGAMASIMAIISKEKHKIWENSQSSLITFGQPRTGDRNYARIHDQKIDTFRKLRFTNALDPIPQLPMPLAPQMEHHSREVWMMRQIWWGKIYWKVCGSKDTSICSKQFRLLPNINDHWLYRYESRILTLPSLYEDKSRNKYSNWKDALRNTCS